MKKLILIASVAAVSVLASCGSKTACSCTVNGVTNKTVYDADPTTKSLSSSQRTQLCDLSNTFAAVSGGSCKEE